MVESALYVQWVFRLDTILALPNRAIGKSPEAMMCVSSAGDE